MNFKLTGNFDANLEEAWQEEYKRIGRIYARWGAILVIFFFPLSIIPELSLEKADPQIWYLFRLGPSVVVAIIYLLHLKFKLSHEFLFEVIAFCLFTSAAYMVECGDWLNYVISMITVFITSAVLVILRPFYFVINYFAVFILQIVVNKIFCDMGVTDYFLLKGVNILLVVGAACFSIAAFRYYIMKNNFLHRTALQRAHFELKEKNQSLMTAQKELRFKSDQIAEQNEELKVQKEEILAQRDAMQSQKDYIEKQNRETLASIRYAKQIQDAMLPAEDLLAKYLPESFVFFKPKDIVSGDFYWITEKNGKIIIAAVDCTGHGVPGAFMSLVGDSTLNQIILTKGITEPAEILKHLHAGIIEALKQDKNESQEGMDAGIVCIDKSSRKISFSGARNPLLIIDKNKEMTELKGDKLSIGGKNQNENSISFTSHSVDLLTDATYYLFSDGFSDQFGGPKDKKFMSSRFKKLLQEISTHSMTDQKFILYNTFKEWKSGFPQTDDVLVLGFKFSQ